MAKLKLVKAKSYYRVLNGGTILATAKKPVISVASEDVDVLLSTGYFALVDDENAQNSNEVETENVAFVDAETLGAMTVTELRNYANEQKIDIEGLTRKAEILEAVSTALGGSSAMLEIQE